MDLTTLILLLKLVALSSCHDDAQSDEWGEWSTCEKCEQSRYRHITGDNDCVTNIGIVGGTAHEDGSTCLPSQQSRPCEVEDCKDHDQEPSKISRADKRSITSPKWNGNLCNTTTIPSLDIIVERFLELIVTVDKDMLDDLEAQDGGLETSRSLFISNVLEEKECEEEVELIIADAEPEEGEIEKEEEEESEDDEGVTIGAFVAPDSLDWREFSILHPPIHQGGACCSCGVVAGVQTLEARMALVSENYQSYSIQNFMNCDKRVCAGSQPYRVNHLVRSNPSYTIVPESESQYVKNACKKWDGGCKCAGGNYTNLLDEQFAFVGGTVAAHSEEALIEALQSGPVTTCFGREGSKGTDEKCAKGCSHANSIIGYTPEHYIMQESYGKTWGHNSNGTWYVPRDSKCAKALLNKAYYPVVHYDYDKANAFYTERTVDQYAVTLVNRQVYGVTERDTSNIGLAKNKCALMGAECKGVMPGESIQLISDFKGGLRAKHPAFLKTQMVIYLKHSSGRYVSIVKQDGVLALILAEKQDAAPFFTSFDRIISFQNPSYHIVEDNLQEFDMVDIDKSKSWSLRDCNLFYPKSELSIDLIVSPNRYYKKFKTIGSSPFQQSSPTQRFDIGISGAWDLESTSLNMIMRTTKSKKKGKTSIFRDRAKMNIMRYRWNARQIVNNVGRPVRPNMNSAPFRLSDTDNQLVPRDCLLSSDGALFLAYEDDEITMSYGTLEDSRWTFEYGDL